MREKKKAKECAFESLTIKEELGKVVNVMTVLQQSKKTNYDSWCLQMKVVWDPKTYGI